MRDMFSRIKDRIIPGADYEDLDYPDEFGDDYLEIDTDKVTKAKAKILVKSFVVNDFEDIKHPLDALREGYTIALVNIKPLKEKDIVELKRAVNKLKKTCDAIDGDIAGFGEDWIVVTPAFAQVHRANIISNPEESTEMRER